MSFPATPVARRPGGPDYRAGFLLALFVLLASGVLGLYHTRRLRENEQLVAHTHRVMEQLYLVRATLRDAEGSKRGYLLTDDEAYLQAFESDLADFDAGMDRLAELVSDNEDQVARMQELRGLAETRVGELRQAVELARGGDRDAALDFIEADVQGGSMDAVLAKSFELRDAERELLALRDEQSRRSYRTAMISNVGTTVLGSLLVGCVFALIHRNLQERRRDAQLVADERERLRVTLASIGDAVIVTDAEGRVTFMNAVAEQLTGWKSEAIGRNLLDIFLIFNEYTGERVESPVTKVLREGKIVGLANHTVLVAKDGVRRPIDDSGAPIRVGDKAIGGVVLVFRDVSERRARERELEEAEARFRVLADSIPQLAWMANPEGDLFWYNQRWYDYTGTTLEQMQGWGWQSVQDPQELPRVVVKWKAHLASGEPWEDSFPLRRHDGQMRWHLSRALPLRDEQGAIVRWFGTNTDITERREMEEELRTLAAHLSEADRRKDEFLAMLAHELRNPLAPIRNGLEILRLAGDPTEDARYAREVMDRQLDQMVRMVDDLLDVSRVTRNLLELRKAPVDLAAAISSAVETSRPLLADKRHELALALPEEPVMLEADRTRLAQVFANLLNNAAKYTEPGGRIELNVAPRDGEAVVTVRDNGIGIPETMLPAVFQLFTQVDRQMERTHGGLGIGLTLVKRLVELHGGMVEAHSEGPGRGSEFVVRLPLADPALRSDDAPPEVPSAQRARRILVVDDNVDSASSLRLMLRMLGHEVELAHDGETAVDQACAYGPDLILLDLGLPKLNGYEACRKIRTIDGERDGAPRKVIVALTGWGQEEDRRRSREAGFDLHLVKPIDLAALQRLLNEA